MDIARIYYKAVRAFGGVFWRMHKPIGEQVFVAALIDLENENLA
jgi:hypothetical protein